MAWRAPFILLITFGHPAHPSNTRIITKFRELLVNKLILSSKQFDFETCRFSGLARLQASATMTNCHSLRLLVHNDEGPNPRERFFLTLPPFIRDSLHIWAVVVHWQEQFCILPHSFQSFTLPCKASKQHSLNSHTPINTVQSSIPTRQEQP